MKSGITAGGAQGTAQGERVQHNRACAQVGEGCGYDDT